MNCRRSQRRQLLRKILEDDYRRYYFDNSIERFLFHIDYCVIDFARRLLPINHDILTTETLLFRVDGADLIQDPHCDLGEEHVGNALLAFVAIKPKTTIML